MPRCKTPSCNNRKFESKTFNQKHCLQTEECRHFAFNKAMHNVQEKRKKDYKKAKQEWSKEKKKKTIELLSKDGYREKYIQPLINEIARIIDKDQPCIASGVTSGKMAGGHYHSVGHNRTLALNLHNVHQQAFHSNGPQGGQHIKYRHGLIRVYGERYTEFIDMYLCQCPALHHVT